MKIERKSEFSLLNYLRVGERVYLQIPQKSFICWEDLLTMPLQLCTVECVEEKKHYRFIHNDQVIDLVWDNWETGEMEID